MSTPKLPTRLASAPGAATTRDSAPPRDLSGIVARCDSAGIDWLDDAATLDEHARDWWPVSIGWAAHGELLARPGIVVLPSSTAAVLEVVAACNDARVPFTVQGGRSGVCGGAVPEPGAVALDLTRLTGVLEFD